MSQDLFQESMDEILFGLNGVISIADDICVFSTDENDHDHNMNELMIKAREHGLVFRDNICFIKVPEITFFESVYSKDGVKSDSERTKEIEQLAVPTNKNRYNLFSESYNIYLHIFLI